MSSRLRSNVQQATVKLPAKFFCPCIPREATKRSAIYGPKRRLRRTHQPPRRCRFPDTCQAHLQRRQQQQQEEKTVSSFAALTTEHLVDVVFVIARYPILSSLVMNIPVSIFWVLVLSGKFLV